MLWKRCRHFSVSHASSDCPVITCHLETTWLGSLLKVAPADVTYYKSAGTWWRHKTDERASKKNSAMLTEILALYRKEF